MRLCGSNETYKEGWKKMIRNERGMTVAQSKEINQDFCKRPSITKYKQNMRKGEMANIPKAKNKTYFKFVSHEKIHEKRRKENDNETKWKTKLREVDGGEEGERENKKQKHNQYEHYTNIIHNMRMVINEIELYYIALQSLMIYDASCMSNERLKQ